MKPRPTRLRRLATGARAHRFMVVVGGDFASQVAIAGLRSVGVVIVARELGPVGQGLVAVALAVPAVLVLLFGVGVPVSATYFVGSRRYEVREVVGHAMALAALGAASALLCAALLVAVGLDAKILPGLSHSALAVALAMVPLGLLRLNLAGIVQGQQRVLHLSMIDTVEAIVLVISIIGATSAFDRSIAAVLTAYAVASFVALGLVVRDLRASSVLCGPKWDRSIAREMTVFGMRGNAGNLLQFLTYRLDTLFVNAWVGSRPAGIYSVAVRIAELLWLLPNAVGRVLLPRSAASTEERSREFAPRVFWATATATVVLAGVLSISADQVIRILFGPGYAHAVSALLVLLPGVIAVSCSVVLSNEMVGRGAPQLNALNSFVGAIATLLFDVALIPWLGVIGAAMASTLVYALNLLLAIVFYERLAGTSWPVWRRTMKWWVIT